MNVTERWRIVLSFCWLLSPLKFYIPEILTLCIFSYFYLWTFAIKHDSEFYLSSYQLMEFDTAVDFPKTAYQENITQGITKKS